MKLKLQINGLRKWNFQKSSRMKKIFIPFLISLFLISCQGEKPIPPEALAEGKEHALLAKQALGGQLMQALATGGTTYALDYCNVEALNITDSLSEKAQVKISRASDQYRNPKNAANADELSYIKAAKASIDQGKQPEPEIKRLNKKLVAYYPIMTNGMCLQCHGTIGQEVTDNTFTKINELYPKDLATGYGLNELRGIWVVEMDD